MAAITDLSRLSARLTQWVPRCSSPSCKTRPLPRLTPWRQLGYSLGEQWFCSSHCFERELQSEVIKLLAPRREAPPRAPRIPLGLLLHSRGVISAEQLSLSLAEQRKSGTNIGDAVIKLGFATELDVTSAAAAQWGLPIFRMEVWQKPAVTGIPYLLMDTHRMLPVHYNESVRQLLVGFVRVPQALALRTIEHMTGCSAVPCFINPTGYDNAIRQLSQNVRENEMVFERNNDPAEIARVVRSYVLQSGAEGARIGICRDYLWAKVPGTRGELDLLFRLEAR